jgi:hypothetical protein
MSQGHTFSIGMLSTDASRAWTVVSTCPSWFWSHRTRDVNWFSKQSAIALAFSFGWYVIPEGPRIAVGAFGQFIFIRDFAIGHRAWGVASQFPNFVPHRFHAFLQIIRLMVLATKLTAVLHAGSWVACCRFLNLLSCLDFYKRLLCSPPHYSQ